MFKLLHLSFSLLSLVEYTLSSAACTNSTFCHQVYGNKSYCSQLYKTNSTGVCGCNDFYYLSNSNCVDCPGYGENCELSGCCNNGNLLCVDRICSCFWAEYCWIVDDGERTRLQTAAQIILAISLFLTAAILFILFRNSCIRQSNVRNQNRLVSQRNRLSLNSIQRLVFLQLQDRPPPYDSDLMSSSKHLNGCMDAPPSYTDAVQLPPLGEENLSFLFGENSPIAQDNLEPGHETPRDNPTLQLSIQRNAENQNELSVSENNSQMEETCSNPLFLVFSQSSVNINSLQSTEGTNNNVSTTHSELHI